MTNDFWKEQFRLQAEALAEAMGEKITGDITGPAGALMFKTALARLRGECPRVHIGVLAIIERRTGWGRLWGGLASTEILMIRRAGAHGDGLWSMSGGRLDREDIGNFGPDIIPTLTGLLNHDAVGACVEREVTEETGLKVEAQTYGRTAVADIIEGQAWVTIFVPCLILGNQEPIIKEPAMCSEVRWVRRDQLPSPGELFAPLCWHPEAWI